MNDENQRKDFPLSTDQFVPWTELRKVLLSYYYV